MADTKAKANVSIPHAGAGSGANHLDRLLAIARAAVVQAIVCHVRVHFYEQALDGRAEIDRIVDRFRPSFPWLGSARIAIKQAASAAVDPKNESGVKRARKAHGVRGDDVAGNRRGQKRKRPGPDPGGATAKAKQADEIEVVEENADRDEIPNPEEARDSSKEDANLDGTSPGGGSGSGGPTRKKSPRARPNIPWSERIAACRAYYAKHGHLNVNAKDPELGHYNDWFMRMRESAIVLEKRGKCINGLNPSRLAELREVGFRSKAERRAERFRHMLAELEKYKVGHGHCNVPKSDALELGKWVRYTRAEYGRLLRGEQSPLSSMDIAKLTEIGLSLPQITRARNRKWEEWMELCRSFLAENGHLKIPLAHPTLGDFCGRVRKAYKDRQEGRQSSLLTEERERELEDMGFVWLAGARLKSQLGPDGRRVTRTFDEWFELLLQFREEHGHVAVPQSHPGGLGAWVAHMRTGARSLRTGEGRLRGMTHERYMRLADAGFVFDMSNRRGLSGCGRSSG